MRAKLYALAVMIFIALAQVYSAWTEAEIFPFSPFNMYSYSTASKDLKVLRIVCANSKTNADIFVSEFDLFRQESDYTSELDEYAYAVGPFTEAQQAPLKRVLAPLFKGLQPDCSSLKLYRYYWKQFTGKTRALPDQKTLIYEYAEGGAR